MAQITIAANVKGTPRWAGDFMSRDHLMPIPARVDPAAFEDAQSVLIKLSAAAAVDATSISVDALSALVPAGTRLYFGESKELALTTADAAAGATSITVQALPTALEDNDEARYSANPTRKVLLSGTLVGRTYAERDAGTAFGPAVSTDDEIFLAAFDVVNTTDNADVELYRPGSVVKENYLPNYAVIAADADLLADLRRVYNCIKGKD